MWQAMGTRSMSVSPLGASQKLGEALPTAEMSGKYWLLPRWVAASSPSLELSCGERGSLEKGRSPAVHPHHVGKATRGPWARPQHMDKATQDLWVHPQHVDKAALSSQLRDHGQLEPDPYVGSMLAQLRPAESYLPCVPRPLALHKALP